jgi:hypothetical protein
LTFLIHIISMSTEKFDDIFKDKFSYNNQFKQQNKQNNLYN